MVGALLLVLLLPPSAAISAGPHFPPPGVPFDDTSPQTFAPTPRPSPAPSPSPTPPPTPCDASDPLAPCFGRPTPGPPTLRPTPGPTPPPTPPPPCPRTNATGLFPPNACYGVELEHERETCAPCAKGSFFDGLRCTQCPASKYNDWCGSRDCLECADGRYSGLGAVKCSLPTSVTASAFRGDTSTAVSPRGGRSTTTPAPFVGCGSGERCVPNCAHPNVTKPCEACPTGTLAEAGHESCATAERGCEPGTFRLVDATAVAGGQCQFCPPGKYSDGGGRDAPCKICPAGKYQRGDLVQERLGSPPVSCVTCDRGSTAPQPGLALCQRCSPGRFADCERRACLPDCFGPGHFVVFPFLHRQANASGNATDGHEKYANGSCVRCPIGRIAPAPSAETIAQLHDDHCEAGAHGGGNGELMREILGGASRCVSCPRGRASDSRGDSCVRRCGIGSWLRRDGAAASCEACPAGRSSTHDIRVSSALGTDVGDGVCKACAAGKFSGTQRVCLPCPTGRFAARAGQNRCHACPKGKHQVYRLDHGTTCRSTAATTTAASVSTLPSSVATNGSGITNISVAETTAVRSSGSASPSTTIPVTTAAAQPAVVSTVPATTAGLVAAGKHANTGADSRGNGAASTVRGAMRGKVFLAGSVVVLVGLVALVAWKRRQSSTRSRYGQLAGEEGDHAQGGPQVVTTDNESYGATNFDHHDAGAVIPVPSDRNDAHEYDSAVVATDNYADHDIEAEDAV